MQIHAQMMQMFESRTFDVAHLEPWLRGFAVVTE
jgi:death-on-curing protein